ncbi:MAG: sigma-70 family RNA polymerase sigma factor [Planctomycetes bacterium]|nr:sigma-70 family RNA polymerase sigma factor [Planctomycetota bacterium]NUQ35414.1 sigma-70 family RNA polymerase sigma factor [Planctomycetaceae bacterium]
MSDLTDYQLLKRFCAGDSDAFETLVARHKRMTYNFIYRMVGNRETADDLFQEMWLKVLRAANTYRPQAKFTTWALQIARNATLDHFKRSGLRRHASLDAGTEDGEGGFAETVRSETPDPDEQLLSGERLELLKRSVEKLPQNQREALILRIYHQLPYSDISELLGTPEGTAKYWVHEAIKSLTENLQREE